MPSFFLFNDSVFFRQNTFNFLFYFKIINKKNRNNYIVKHIFFTLFQAGDKFTLVIRKSTGFAKVVVNV